MKNRKHEASQQKPIQTPIVNHKSPNVDESNDEGQHKCEQGKQVSFADRQFSEIIQLFSHQDQSNKSIVRATIILAIVSIIGLGINGFQIYKAWESVKIENRAYLSILDIQPSGMQLGGIPTINFKIANLGKTPAFKVKVFTYFSTNPRDTSIRKFDRFVPDTGISLGPGLQNPYGAPYKSPKGDTLHITAQDVRAFESGVAFYFYAKVVYIDQFKATHFVKFGSKYNWNAKTTDAIMGFDESDYYE